MLLEELLVEGGIAAVLFLWFDRRLRRLEALINGRG